MKVLPTGAAGQLGQALLASRPEGVELIATSRAGVEGLLPLDLGPTHRLQALCQLLETVALEAAA